MEFKISVLLLLVALVIFLIIFELVRRGRIPVKFSILWYFLVFILLICSLAPNILLVFAGSLGFQTMSNWLIGVLLFALILMSIALTVIVSGQNRKIILLIQEISILKKEIEINNKRKNEDEKC